MRKNITKAIFTTSVLLCFTLVSQAKLQTTKQRPSLRYCVVDTGQTKCYDTIAEISAPLLGQSFYGQDAQFFGNQASYIHLEQRRQDHPRQCYEIDLDARPQHHTRNPHEIRQEDLQTGASLGCHSQRYELRRIQRLASSDHQGAVFADKLQWYQSQRIYWHRHLRSQAFH